VSGVIAYAASCTASAIGVPWKHLPSQHQKMDQRGANSFTSPFRLQPLLPPGPSRQQQQQQQQRWGQRQAGLCAEVPGGLRPPCRLQTGTGAGTRRPCPPALAPCTQQPACSRGGRGKEESKNRAGQASLRHHPCGLRASTPGASLLLLGRYCKRRLRRMLPEVRHRVTGTGRGGRTVQWGEVTHSSRC